MAVRGGTVFGPCWMHCFSEQTKTIADKIAKIIKGDSNFHHDHPLFYRGVQYKLWNMLGI